MPLARWLKATLDFCFPGSCAACKAESDGVPLCEKCHHLLDGLMTAAACDQCAMPLAYHHAPCPHCHGKGNRPFDRIIALGCYDDPIRTLVHHIKYHRAWPLAEYLTDCLIENEAAKTMLTETDVLIPLPLHPIRQLARGYNQAALISRRLSRSCKIAHADPLIRVRNTETQTHFHSHAKRKANLENAFALSSEKSVRGKHIVLVDDVLTTGATLHAAAKALRPGKPASISAIVLAVADPRRPASEPV